jgi:hypothetical protein
MSKAIPEIDLFQSIKVLIQAAQLNFTRISEINLVSYEPPVYTEFEYFQDFHCVYSSLRLSSEITI